MLVLLTLGLVGATPPASAESHTRGPATYRLPTGVSPGSQGGDHGPGVVHPFRAPEQPWSAGHRGVDLEPGADGVVVAPAAGVVAFAGVVVDRGVLTIAHPDGRLSSLEPVTAAVEPGQVVVAGQVVGWLSGERSHCAAPCLHWGVRLHGAYVDPLDLVPELRIVLLPLPAG